MYNTPLCGHRVLNAAIEWPDLYGKSISMPFMVNKNPLPVIIEKVKVDTPKSIVPPS